MNEVDVAASAFDTLTGLGVQDISCVFGRAW